MKAKTTKVAIPRGWRKLRVGVVLKHGDEFYFPDDGKYWPTCYAGKRVGESPNQGITYFRKSTARPRSRKVSQAGGRKK